MSTISPHREVYAFRARSSVVPCGWAGVSGLTLGGGKNGVNPIEPLCAELVIKCGMRAGSHTPRHGSLGAFLKSYPSCCPVRCAVICASWGQKGMAPLQPFTPCFQRANPMWRKLALLSASAALLSACEGGTAPMGPDAKAPTPVLSGGTLGSGYASGQSTGDPAPATGDSATTRYGGTLGSGY